MQNIKVLSFKIVFVSVLLFIIGCKKVKDNSLFISQPDRFKQYCYFLSFDNNILLYKFDLDYKRLVNIKKVNVDYSSDSDSIKIDNIMFYKLDKNMQFAEKFPAQFRYDDYVWELSNNGVFDLDMIDISDYKQFSLFNRNFIYVSRFLFASKYADANLFYCVNKRIDLEPIKQEKIDIEGEWNRCYSEDDVFLSKWVFKGGNVFFDDEMDSGYRYLISDSGRFLVIFFSRISVYRIDRISSDTIKISMKGNFPHREVSVEKLIRR